MFKKAFTLAEVLITLAIIGVVAALTIPTLLAQNQQKAWNTAATVFEKRLEVALRTMNTQQVLAGYKTTEDFVAALSNEMKITKVCKNNELTECVSDDLIFEVLSLKGNVHSDKVEETTEDKIINTETLKTSSEIGHKDWGTNVVGIQLNNGTAALLAYNPECKQDPYNNQFNGLGCVAAVYDTSGYAKPNTSGKDVRTLNATLTKCDFMLNGTCYGLPFKSSHYLTKSECEARKGELGINNCNVENDYWAGAIETCGGNIANLPTLHTDLYLLQIYLYHSTGSHSYMGSGNEVLDEERAAKLGLSEISSSRVLIWSSSECYAGDPKTMTCSYSCSYDKNNFDWYQRGRNNASLYTICKYD